MGSRCVDNGGVGIFNHCHRLFRRLVGQTEKAYIGKIDRFFSPFRILSLGIGKCDKLNVLSLLQAVGNSQSRCSGASVNEYFCHSSPSFFV